jgi:hypothetical protein
MWFSLWADNRSDWVQFTKSMRTTVIVVGSVYSAAALVGLLGFLGACFRKNAFIRTFFIMLCTTFGFQVGSGIWYLITFYRTRGQSYDDCVNGSTDSNRITYCESLNVYKKIPPGYLIAAVIVPVVIQAYGCYVVFQYSKRIESQKLEKHRQSQVNNTYGGGPVYQPVAHQDESYPLAAPYPYASGPNAFGHQPHQSMGGNEYKV